MELRKLEMRLAEEEAREAKIRSEEYNKEIADAHRKELQALLEEDRVRKEEEVIQRRLNAEEMVCVPLLPFSLFFFLLQDCFSKCPVVIGWWWLGIFDSVFSSDGRTSQEGPKVKETGGQVEASHSRRGEEGAPGE